MAIIAAPLFSVGTKVNYLDREGRFQTGTIRRINAYWTDKPEPLIIYSIFHPTYRNKNFCTTSKNILGEKVGL